MYLAVKDVETRPDYQLLLTFENGVKKIFDMMPYLETGIFRELKDPDLFNSVKVSFDTIAWDNEADLDPEFLYENGTEL